MRHHAIPCLIGLAVAGLALALGLAQPAVALDSVPLLRTQARDGRPDATTPFVPRVPARPERRNSGPARDAVKRGEIRPLEEVTARVQSRYPGRLLDVRLDDAGGRPTYYLKMLTRDGRVLNVAVDARTAQILGVKGAR